MCAMVSDFDRSLFLDSQLHPTQPPQHCLDATDYVLHPTRDFYSSPIAAYKDILMVAPVRPHEEPVYYFSASTGCHKGYFTLSESASTLGSPSAAHPGLIAFMVDELCGEPAWRIVSAVDKMAFCFTTICDVRHWQPTPVNKPLVMYCWVAKRTEKLIYFQTCIAAADEPKQVYSTGELHFFKSNLLRGLNVDGPMDQLRELYVEFLKQPFKRAAEITLDRTKLDDIAEFCNSHPDAKPVNAFYEPDAAIDGSGERPLSFFNDVMALQSHSGSRLSKPIALYSSAGQSLFVAVYVGRDYSGAPFRAHGGTVMSLQYELAHRLYRSETGVFGRVLRTKTRFITPMPIDAVLIMTSKVLTNVDDIQRIGFDARQDAVTIETEIRSKSDDDDDENKKDKVHSRSWVQIAVTSVKDPSSSSSNSTSRL